MAILCERDILCLKSIYCSLDKSLLYLIAVGVMDDIKEEMRFFLYCIREENGSDLTDLARDLASFGGTNDIDNELLDFYDSEPEIKKMLGMFDDSIKKKKESEDGENGEDPN